MGYTPQVGIGGGYGVKAVLRGGRPGKTIALRADMDALPITEATGLPYASTVPGVMHACGHDMHTATLLAVAKALTAVAHELAGNVVFLFQPAEETPPGGAKAMIEDGALENPRVDAVFGMHVDPFLPAGQLSFSAGPVNVAPDQFDLTIQGRGGHGAAPHQTIDAVVVGAQVVNALQHIHSRQISPFERLVITVGHFTGGSNHNIASMMEQVFAGVCSSYGATYTFNYTYGYPVLVNDPAMTEVARAAGVATVGADNVHPAEPGMRTRVRPQSPSTSLGTGVLCIRTRRSHLRPIDARETR